MNFSLQYVYVVQTGNVLPTSGSTQNLTPLQFGIFNQNYVPVVTGTAAAARYLRAVQGNSDGTKESIKSDALFKDKIIKMTKIVAEDTAALEIWQVSDLLAHCGEQISLSFRLFSNYINTSFYNGLTATVTASTPCCACDGDPCEELTADQYQALADELVAKVNDPKRNWFNFISAVRTGTGAASAIRISAKPIDQEGNQCDLRANPFEYDAVTMNLWIYKGVPTTQDHQLYGPEDCENVGTITKLQSMNYTRGSWQMVQQVEKQEASRKQAAFGTLYRNPNFNGWFESNVQVGTYYDQYMIKFYTKDSPNSWSNFEQQDSIINIFVPTGAGATIETIFETFAGFAFDEPVGPNVSTTTTSTSTSSSSTSSTTTTLP